MSDSQFENWWNSLKPEQRVHALQIIPLRTGEQVEVFSSRRWHELHGWMRDDLRKLYGTPGLLATFDMFVYFRAQQRLGRGQCIQGVTYFVISDADCERLRELAQSYAVAFEELTTNGKTQHWLISSEAEYDDEILLALSSVALSNRNESPSQ